MLERLRALRPWETCSEEDLFRFEEEFYLSIRGQLRRPNGVLVTDREASAESWVMQPDQPLDETSWLLDADAGTWRDGAGQPVSAELLPRLERAVRVVLNQFDDGPTEGLEFPIWFNL